MPAIILICFFMFGTGFADTIPDIMGRCLLLDQLAKTNVRPEQSCNLMLKNDTLSFWGIINHNCCGSHFMEFKIAHDTISLNPIDTGTLCMCICPFSFSIRIPDLYKNQYHIHCYTLKLDTLISSSTRIEKKYIQTTKPSLNCTQNILSKSVQISLFGVQDISVPVRIYRIDGTLYQSLKFDKNGFCLWKTQSVPSGRYIISYKDNRFSFSRNLFLQ